MSLTKSTKRCSDKNVLRPARLKQLNYAKFERGTCLLMSYFFTFLSEFIKNGWWINSTYIILSAICGKFHAFICVLIRNLVVQWDFTINFKVFTFINFAYLIFLQNLPHLRRTNTVNIEFNSPLLSVKGSTLIFVWFHSFNKTLACRI